MARPGEFVDFTIRFDNIGDQKIGNVTLVDNLTTRLEYVEGTAESSLAADFSTTCQPGRFAPLALGVRRAGRRPATGASSVSVAGCVRQPWRAGGLFRWPSKWPSRHLRSAKRPLSARPALG